MTNEIPQGVVRLLFGDGKIAHRLLGWDIEKVTGPDPDFITRCVLGGRTWGKLEPDEKGLYAGSQRFNLARSAKIKELRGKLASIEHRLTDIRFLEIPQRSFTPDEAAGLLHISPSRLSEMINQPKGDRALVKHITAHHMPRKPMLIDILLNAPITLKEALDLIERHWRGWSPERRAFMKIWSMPEVIAKGFISRAVWSRHKLAILEDLRIPNSSKWIQRVLRWPDVWAWRGLLCGQALHEAGVCGTIVLSSEIAMEQARLDEMIERIKLSLDKLG